MFNETLLQIKTTPAKYTKLLHFMEVNNIRPGTNEYWDFIPVYGVSRCPYCNTVYTEALDTYTLRKWIVWGASGLCIYHQNYKNHCKHMVYTQAFINLHGIIPETSDTELRLLLDLTSELPFVVPFLLESDVENHSVLHSLPICRIEGDQFVPRYTLYMVTMFAPNPEPLVDELRKFGEGMDMWTSFLTFPPREDYADWYDLEKWVKAGKLSWIEPDNPEIKLVSDPVKDFPYKNLEGRKRPYQVGYRDGRVFEDDTI